MVNNNTQEPDRTATLQRQIDGVGQLTASTVLSDHGLTAALEEITEVAARALDVDHVSSWHHSTENTEWTCAEAYFGSRNLHRRGAVIDMSQHQTYLDLVESEHVVAINDVANDARVGSLHGEVLAPLNIRAMLLVSRRKEGRFIGSLTFSMSDGAHAWTSEEQAFAGVFAEIASRTYETHERQQADIAFRDFANAASDWFWQTDVDDRFVYISDNFFEVTGEAPSDTIGKTRSEMDRLIPDPTKAEAFRKTIEDCRPFRDVVVVRTLANGKQQWSQSSGTPIFDRKDQFEGYRGISTDVTDQINDKIALEDSETRFQNLLEAAPVPMAVFANSRFVYSNKLAHGLFGRSAEELYDLSPTSLYVDPAERATLITKLESIGAVTNHETRLKRADGTEFWASISSTKMVYQGEDAYFSSFSDISERKAAERTLADNAALLRTILDAIPGSLSYRDLDGRMQFMNRQGAAYFDRPQKEFIGKTLQEMFGAVDGPTLETLTDQVIETGQPMLNREFSTPRVQGRIFNYNIVPVRDLEDKMVGVVSASNEITARKQSEDQLRRSEARFRSLVENSIQGLCIQRNGQILFANQALADINGYDQPADIMALTPADIFLPSEAELEERKKTGNRLRVHGTRHDGSDLWIEIMSNTLDWDGEIAQQYMIVDVTAEVIADQERELLANALENFPEAIALYDRDDVLIFQNATYRKNYRRATNFDPLGHSFEENARASALPAWA